MLKDIARERKPAGEPESSVVRPETKGMAQ
jgi:hypothetical protein